MLDKLLPSVDGYKASEIKDHCFGSICATVMALQITIETENASKDITDVARSLGREFVISVTGKVAERYSKSDKIETGDIELNPAKIAVLNPAITPPFTIEDETDGGDDIRMKYRYLDLRRNAVGKNLELRHRIAIETRNYLDRKSVV